MWLREKKKNNLKAWLDFIVPIKSTITEAGEKEKKNPKESTEQVKT